MPRCRTASPPEVRLLLMQPHSWGYTSHGLAMGTALTPQGSGDTLNSSLACDDRGIRVVDGGLSQVMSRGTGVPEGWSVPSA